MRNIFMIILLIFMFPLVSSLYSGETQTISTDYINITECQVKNNISFVNCSIVSLNSVNVSIPQDAVQQNFNIVILGWKEHVSTPTPTTYYSGGSGGGTYPSNYWSIKKTNSTTNRTITPIPTPVPEPKTNQTIGLNDNKKEDGNDYAIIFLVISFISVIGIIILIYAIFFKKPIIAPQQNQEINKS